MGLVVKIEVAFGGDLFVLPRVIAQKIFLMAMGIFDNVEASCGRTLSSSQVNGIMPDVIVSEEKDRVIGSSLKDKCVIEAKRIVRKVNGVLVPTESFVLTFPKTLPTRVTFAYMSFPMPPFVYRPMQCKKCHRIGHKAKHCIHPACCAMCWDSPHDGANSSKAHFFPQCQLANHTTVSPDCPRFKLNSKILQITAERNISYLEARHLVQPRSSAISATRSLSPEEELLLRPTGGNSELISLKAQVNQLEAKVAVLSTDIKRLLSLVDQFEHLIISFCALTKNICSRNINK